MANKAPINQYEQRTMLNGQTLNAPVRPVVNNVMQEIAAAGKELGGILAKQNDRIDALKLRNNEEKLSIEVAKMNNELAQADTTEKFVIFAPSSVFLQTYAIRPYKNLFVCV